MNKIFSLITYVIFFIFFHTTTFAQVLSQHELNNHWNRFYINDVGSIDFPQTIEVLKDELKKVHHDLIVREHGPTYQLFATQKLGKPKNKKKYARVMIKTQFGKKDDYLKLDFDIQQFKKDDIIKLDNEAKKITKDYLGNGKIIEWHQTKVESINGMSCFHISYTRQLNNNPIVLVNIYTFFNNDRLHTLTLSYRLSESKYWKEDFITILNSLRITKIQ